MEKTNINEKKKESILSLFENIAAGMGATATMLSFALIAFNIEWWKIVLFVFTMNIPAMFYFMAYKKNKKGMD